MSICDDLNHTYAFMLTKAIIPMIIEFLSSDVAKIASNLKFEHTWSEVCFGVEVQNWFWDTMLAAHVLDNRSHISGLKFQTFVNFGVFGYDAEVSPFLKGVEKKNANSLNRIDELIKTESGRQKLLIYCGMDSLFEYRLAMIQHNKLQRN
jgi:hypothetical protein